MKSFVQGIWTDTGYAVRWLSHSPGFTAAAIMTIASGVGLNAGVFTVLNGVLFRDLPVPNARELVSITQTVKGVPDLMGQDAFSTADYLAYRNNAQALSGLAASAGVRGETTLGGNVPQKIYGMLVSCNYFDVVKQPPRLGRGFEPKECEPGAEPVVMLGHELWK